MKLSVSRRFLARHEWEPMNIRLERIARNESLFREVNEQIEVGAEKFSIGREPAEFVCECGRAGCSQLIKLTLAEYEAVRAHPDRFAIVGGHEILMAERVVEEHEGYAVVETVAEGSWIAEELDPRATKAHGGGG